MKISGHFNRFMFGVILKDIRNADVLIFKDFNFKFRPRQIASESMRELFKHLDLSYPRDDKNIPMSYTKLDSKQMTRHVQFIERVAGFSGHEMKHISEEWNRLLQQAGIVK